MERSPAKEQAQEPSGHKDVGEVLFTAQQIQRRVEELGHELSQDYAGKTPVLIGVLKGVLPFLADLMRRLTLDTEIELLAVHRPHGYGHPELEITRDVRLDIAGRDVIVVEDIVDMGQTLQKILAHLREKGPASLEVCTLLDKPSRRVVEVPVKYIGFKVPDRFVIGYGLDFEERFRNLPFIGTMTVEPKRRG